MKKAIGGLGGLAALLFALAVVALATASNDQTNFKAHLNGAQEVPTRATLAQGQAILQLSDDGTALDVKLIVANIENVFAAHIHCAPAGVNGPIGVTLFMGAPGSGRFDGVLAERTVTAPDPGNACGWTNLGSVVAALRSGNAYVNVHTNDGVAPPNTGPGDFPGGEMRGQVS